MSRVDNGRRVPVKFGTYEGEAGVAVGRRGLEVAFFDLRRSTKVGAIGTIDGIEHTVIAIEPGTVRGMIKLTVEPVQ